MRKLTLWVLFIIFICCQAMVFAAPPYSGGAGDGWGAGSSDVGQPTGLSLGGGVSPNVSISSGQNQVFAPSQVSTAISPITITDASTPVITSAGGIRIAVPSGFYMNWDSTITTAVITGSGASKVSPTVSYEDNNRILKLDVNADFSTGQNIIVSGLNFKNFANYSRMNYNLELHLVISGGVNVIKDDKFVVLSNQYSGNGLGDGWSMGQSSAVSLVSAVKLVINSSVQNVTAGVVSTAVTVQAQGSGSSLANSFYGTINIDSTSATMRFDISNTGAFDGGITSISLSAGQGTFYFKDTTAATPTITLLYMGLTSATQQETINPAAASVLAFSQQPSSAGVSGANFTTQPVIEIRDTYGNRCISATNSITLAAYLSDETNPAPGILNADSNPLSAVAGQAVFSGVNYSGLDTIKLKATPLGFPVFSNAITMGIGALSNTNIVPADFHSDAGGAVVGSKGNAGVEFTVPVDDPMPANGKIKVAFPSGFILNSGGTTTASIVSGLDGTLSALISGQAITITRSGGTAKTGDVSLILSNIKNPAVSGPTSTYAIETQDSAGNTLCRDNNVSGDFMFGVIFSSPNSSSSWSVGDDNKQITWTEDSTFNNFLFQYYDTSWHNCQNDGADVSGSYTSGGASALWDISSGVSILSTYKVRAYDTTLGYAVGESQEFTIKGGVVLTAPAGGEKWSISQPHQINWTTSGTFSKGVKVTYSTDSTNGTDGSWSAITAYASSSDAVSGSNQLSNADNNGITTGTCYWLPSRDLAAGSINVWVRVSDANTSAPPSFSVTASALKVAQISYVSMLLPGRSGTAIQAGVDLNINISSVGVTNVTIQYKSYSGGGTYVTCQNSSGVSASDVLVSSLPFSWRVPDDVSPSAGADIKVTASASSGISGGLEKVSSGFTIYGTLTRTSPVSGSYKVNDSSNRVSIVWSGSSSISAVNFQYTQDFASPSWQNIPAGEIYTSASGSTNGYNWSADSGTAWWQAAEVYRRQCVVEGGGCQ